MSAGSIYKIVGRAKPQIRCGQKSGEFWALVRPVVAGRAIPRNFAWR